MIEVREEVKGNSDVENENIVKEGNQKETRFVIKRSGKQAPYSPIKIRKTIENANNEEARSDKKLTDEQIDEIVDIITSVVFHQTRALSVEEIQDIVQEEICKRSYSVFLLFHDYRNLHEQKRNMTGLDEKIRGIIEVKKTETGQVTVQNEDVKQENSNKNPTILSVQRDYMAGEWSRYFTNKYLLPADIAKAHEEGLIHFHDADYFSQHMHNCFTGGTKFITNSGIRQFRDFNDGDIVFVKDKDGITREATVHKYGKQNMQVVTLKAGRMERNVICTKDHRWILKDGSVTTNLSVGDYLWKVIDSTYADIINYDDAKAFCEGFVIGDGCDLKNNAVAARLCGDKAKHLDIFKMAGYSVSQINGSKDIYVRKHGAFKQDFINGKCWKHLSARQQEMLFKGYYAADGAKNATKICTSDQRLCEMIEDISGMAGYYISSMAIETRDTPYKENSVLYAYHFITHNANNNTWKVKNIEPYSHSDVDAWCVEEPVTHSFTLEGGIVTGNCDLINLDDMLQNGTSISGTHIDRPKSFATACTVASQIVSQVASSQYGGQSFSVAHLAPFVDVSRKKIRRRLGKELTAAGVRMDSEKFNEFVENELIKEVESGCQTIQYQLITLQSTNGQAPFVTAFMYLHEAPEGQTRDDLALIIKVMLEQRIMGVKDRSGAYITPAFPKLIYVLQEDNIYEGSKYFYLTKLAAKCTAKRMVPDYISEKKMMELKGDVYTCMGCRSFLTPDRFTDAGVGNIANALNYEEGKHKYYGRFNQGVVTINLVDVACSSGQDENKFWSIMDDRLELCHRALRIRHERLLGTPSDVAPILWQDGALARLKPGETIDRLLYDGYSTISLGYAGLAECVRYMKGCSHTSDEGKEFGLKVMQALNDACGKWKAAENIDYSVYGTPLESTTYKFAKCLQRRFGKIEGVTDRNYITNSYHIHVAEHIDAFSKLSKEAEFQTLSPGGAISYVECPDMTNNLDAVLMVMQHIYNTIIYAELNTKSDYCGNCGYDGEIRIITDNNKLIWECPNCGCRDESKMHVARRTCGYIGTSFWNQGRTSEINDRVLHLG